MPCRTEGCSANSSTQAAAQGFGKILGEACQDTDRLCLKISGIGFEEVVVRGQAGRGALGQLVLGSGFDPRDLLAYATGVVAALLLERAVG